VDRSDETHLMVGRFPAAYYEIISIAQSVARSGDAARLIEAADEQFPEEAATGNVLRFRAGRAGDYADMTFGYSADEEPVSMLGGKAGTRQN
jgi:hypothetical protein